MTNMPAELNVLLIIGVIICFTLPFKVFKKVKFSILNKLMEYLATDEFESESNQVVVNVFNNEEFCTKASVSTYDDSRIDGENGYNPRCKKNLIVENVFDNMDEMLWKKQNEILSRENKFVKQENKFVKHENNIENVENKIE